MRRHRPVPAALHGAAVPDVVRLRLSAWALGFVILRWTVGVAVTVVAMWIGAAFLASPAAAAAAPATTLPSQVLLAGKTTSRAAADRGGEGGDSGGNDDSRGDRRGDDRGTEPRGRDSEKQSDSGKGNDSEGKDSKDSKGKKKDVKKKDKKEEDKGKKEKESPEEIRENLKKLHDAVEAQPEDRRDDTRTFLAAEKKRQDKERADDRKDEDRDEGGDRDGGESPEEVRKNLKKLHDSVEAQPEDQRDDTRRFLAEEKRRQDAEKRRRDAADERRNAPSRPASAGDDQETPEEFRENLRKLHEAVEALPEDEQAKTREFLRREATRQEAERSSVAETQRALPVTEESPEEFARNLRELREAVEALPEAEQAETREFLRREATRQARESGDTGRETDTDEVAGRPKLTNQVLEGRLEISRGEQVLADEKRAVDAGRLDVEVYKQHLIAHAALAERVDAESAQLSPDHAALINDVVTMHRNLDRSDDQLMLEEQLVARGELDPAVHARHKAEVEARRAPIMALTDRLRELSGVDAADVLAEGDVAASGCERSGAFVECQARSGTGETDRCVALAGAANACVVSAGSARDKAEASCIIDGANHGCVSNVTREVDGKTLEADTWCSSPTGACDQTSGVGVDGATMVCAAGSECRGSAAHGTGPITGAANPARGPPGSTEASATCIGRCEIAGEADRDSAAVDCVARVGGCTVQTSGHIGPTPGSRPAIDDSRGGTGEAHCLTASNCAVIAAIDVQDGAGAEASTRCADRPGACGGGATSAATASRLTVHSNSAAQRDEASGLATCTVGRGNCAANAGAEVTGTHVASGTASTSVICGADCDGRGRSDTGATATDSVAGMATAPRTWASHGTGRCGTRGGECASESASQVGYATPLGAGPRTEVIATSAASAHAVCTDASRACAGQAGSSTDASDSAFNGGHARGSGSEAACTVTGGTCNARTQSLASSRGDYAAGQPGPSSTSAATAGVTCATGAACSGTASTRSFAFDRAQPGVIHTSGRSVACHAAGCRATSASMARTGAAGTMATSDPRLVAQAVSAATPVCDRRTCSGTLTFPATGTDMLGSPDRRTSACADACHAVTSSSSKASLGFRMVRAEPASHATAGPTDTDDSPKDETSGIERQPALPPAGASGAAAANGGGPTGPGGSSGPNPAATTDCWGGSGCPGTVRTTAVGIDGPDLLAGGPGARGPPAVPGTTRSSRGCSPDENSCHPPTSTADSCSPDQSGCRELPTSDTARAGQITADTIAVRPTPVAEPAQDVGAEAAAPSGASSRTKTQTARRRALADPAHAHAALAVDAATEPAWHASTAPPGSDSLCAGRRSCSPAESNAISRTGVAYAPVLGPPAGESEPATVPGEVSRPLRSGILPGGPVRGITPYWHRGLVDPDAHRSRDAALSRTPAAPPDQAPFDAAEPGLQESADERGRQECSAPHSAFAVRARVSTSARRPSSDGARAAATPETAPADPAPSAPIPALPPGLTTLTGPTSPDPTTTLVTTSPTRPEVPLGHAIGTTEAQAPSVPRGPARARAPPIDPLPRQSPQRPSQIQLDAQMACRAIRRAQIQLIRAAIYWVFQGLTNFVSCCYRPVPPGSLRDRSGPPRRSLTDFRSPGPTSSPGKCDQRWR